jgi:hypothetical protein
MRMKKIIANTYGLLHANTIADGQNRRNTRDTSTEGWVKAMQKSNYAKHVSQGAKITLTKPGRYHRSQS